jgi:DNA (cytosine-5)-methyltransferase 1
MQAYKPRHISLFSGIGGFDLAAQWAGWENVAHCEINPFGQRVLKYWWPNSESLTDITKTDFTKYHGTIDVISGGFPCQPFSLAGKRKGTADSRHLWPEMLTAIREVKPRWVVGENVFGFVNWDGGLVFDQVHTDLEALGYTVQSYIVPACAKNAPHRRDRVWIVAHSNDARNDSRHGGTDTDGAKESGERELSQPKFNGQGDERVIANTRHIGPSESGIEPMGFEQLHEGGDVANSTISRRAGQESNSGTTQGFGKSSDVEQPMQIEPTPNSQIDEQRKQAVEGVRPKLGERVDANSTGRRARIIRNTGKAARARKGRVVFGRVHRLSHERIFANTVNQGLQRGKDNGSTGRSRKEREKFTSGFVRTNWQEFPTQSHVCGRNDGLSYGLVDIAFPKWRNESIKAFGNAVVPQVVYEFFKTINEYEGWQNSTQPQ